MISIDTTIEPTVVEIDGEEYEVAARTVEICDKLNEAIKKCMGKPEYRLKLMQLEILLGKTAFRKLFPHPERENVDRLDSIYKGVSQAFTAHEEALEGSDIERQVERMRTALGPLSELMQGIKAVGTDSARAKHPNIRQIKRG